MGSCQSRTDEASNSSLRYYLFFEHSGWLVKVVFLFFCIGFGLKAGGGGPCKFGTRFSGADITRTTVSRQHRRGTCECKSVAFQFSHKQVLIIIHLHAKALFCSSHHEQVRDCVSCQHTRHRKVPGKGQLLFRCIEWPASACVMPLGERRCISMTSLRILRSPPGLPPAATASRPFDFS